MIETTVGYTANDKPMAEAIVAMWRDIGVNAKVEVLEFSVRAQKNRDRSFKGSGGRTRRRPSAIPTA